MALPGTRRRLRTKGPGTLNTSSSKTACGSASRLPLEALPGVFFWRVLVDGGSCLADLLQMQMVYSRLHQHWADALATVLAKTTLHARVLLGALDAGEEIALHKNAFLKQSPSQRPLCADFLIKDHIDLTTGLPAQLASLLGPFRKYLHVELRVVAGLESVPTVLAKWPVTALAFAELEEEDLPTLCKLFTSSQSTCRDLSALSVENFCRDDPSAKRLATLLRALPTSCTELHIRYALPIAQAFARVPCTVRRLGTLVLMAEVFYHSHIAGMTLSKFEATFPVLRGVRELDVVLGPGHYTEPTWQHTPRQVVDMFLRKMPALARLNVAAIVESSCSPPLSLLTAAFDDRQVRFEVVSVRKLAPRMEPIDEWIRAAHCPGFAKFSDSC